MSHSVIDLAGQ